MSMVPASTVRHLPSPTEGIVIDRDAVMRSLNLNPTDPKTMALLLVCERYDLDPLLKHIVLISGNAYVTRDGYLTVAHRSGQFDGMEVLEQGETTSHYTAKVAVYRKDMTRPFAYVGRFPKAKPMAKDYGPEMAVKVAEVQALRRAFNVTGIAAADEQWDAVPDTLPANPELHDDPNAADDWDRQSIAARIEALGEEWKQNVATDWRAAALPKIGSPDLTKTDVDAALNILSHIEEEATATYDRRRKLILAKLKEASITSEDARHQFVGLATGGATESTKRLTQFQFDAIVAEVQALLDEEAARTA